MVRIFEDQIPGLTCAIILFKCNLICMNYNSCIIQHYIVIVITQTCIQQRSTLFGNVNPISGIKHGVQFSMSGNINAIYAEGSFFLEI